MRGEVLVVLIVVAISMPAASAGNDNRSPEERLSELLMAWPQESQALRGLQDELLNVRLGPADHGARECLRELARVAQRLEFGIRQATGDMTFREFHALREEQPDAAKNLAGAVMEEIGEAQAYFAEHFHAPQDCMLRD